MKEIKNHLHNSLITEAMEASTWVWDLVTNEVSVNDRIEGSLLCLAIGYYFTDDKSETLFQLIKESDAKMYQDKKELYETNGGFKEFKLEV